MPDRGGESRSIDWSIDRSLARRYVGVGSALGCSCIDEIDRWLPLARRYVNFLEAQVMGRFTSRVTEHPSTGAGGGKGGARGSYDVDGGEVDGSPDRKKAKVVITGTRGAAAAAAAAATGEEAESSAAAAAAAAALSPASPPVRSGYDQ